MTAWGFSSTHTSAQQKFWRRETRKSRVDSLCAGISALEMSSWSTDWTPEPAHIVILLITRRDSKKWSPEGEGGFASHKPIVVWYSGVPGLSVKRYLMSHMSPQHLKDTMVKTNLTELYPCSDEIQVCASSDLDYHCQGNQLSQSKAEPKHTAT